jgi:archaellin
MAMKYPVLVFMIVLFSILIAGCTNETPAAPVTTTSFSDSGSSSQDTPLQCIGEVTGQGSTGKTIDVITLTVGLVPGGNNIVIDKLGIIYADAIRTETLKPVEGFHSENPPQGSWSIVRVENEVGSPNNRLSFEERFVLRLNPTNPIVPGQVITLLLKPEEGGTLSIRGIAPPTIGFDNIISPR